MGRAAKNALAQDGVCVLIQQANTNQQPHHADITLHFGLDVHKDSITPAIAQPGSKGEVRLFGTITNDIDRLEKALRRICKARPHAPLEVPMKQAFAGL